MWPAALCALFVELTGRVLRPFSFPPAAGWRDKIVAHGSLPRLVVGRPFFSPNTASGVYSPRGEMANAAAEFCWPYASRTVRSGEKKTQWHNCNYPPPPHTHTRVHSSTTTAASKLPPHLSPANFARESSLLNDSECNNNVFPGEFLTIPIGARVLDSRAQESNRLLS